MSSNKKNINSKTGSLKLTANTYCMTVDLRNIDEIEFK